MDQEADEVKISPVFDFQGFYGGICPLFFGVYDYEWKPTWNAFLQSLKNRDLKGTSSRLR